MTDNTEAEAWRAHEPAWSDTADPDFPDERAVTGCSCGNTPPADWSGTRWFGGHLTEMGGPDYIQTYWKDWAHLVEAPDGALNRDAVARELSDYSFVMEQVGIVYSELADLSKPNYYAYAILGAINDRQEKHYREHYAGRLCDRAEETDNEAARAVLVEMAEEWSPGSWAEYRQGKEMVARLQAEKVAG